MTRVIFNKFSLVVYIIPLILLFACSSPGNKNLKVVDKEKNGYKIGSYGYDIAFLKENNIKAIELKDSESKACVVVIPDYQGRVMTSSADGNNGRSYGWINYKLIESGEVNSQFNPFGGEERFWLGPEGGPYSIYFSEGEDQVFNNWAVPPVIDTETYDVKALNARSVKFAKSTVLKNALGTEFQVGIERTVSLLSVDTLCSLFNIEIPSDIFDVVSYQSENTITNIGKNAWTKDQGLLSIWMLSMFNPSPTTTVFIPYKTGGNGVVVNDEYFGKVPSDRLMVSDNTVYFKIDGKYRSKIGLPPGRAKELCGSYDSDKNLLTLLWCSVPSEPKEYVNSKWGDQDNPFNGDVINSYNDGPVEDGSIMGPFYEIETSSPAADLQPGESITHIQVIVHIQGDEKELAKIVNTLFNLNLFTIASKFQKSSNEK